MKKLQDICKSDKLMLLLVHDYVKNECSIITNVTMEIFITQSIFIVSQVRHYSSSMYL